MPFYAGFLVFLLLLGLGFFAVQMRTRVRRLESRLNWYEAIMRRAGLQVDPDDYIQYCLINEGRARALAEYVRLNRVSLDQAQRALQRIEAELRDA